MLVGALGALVGWREYLLVQAPTALMAGAAGVFLFYVQHQFEGTYWTRSADWSFADAALEGSSYLKLPKVLQFFTGSIGLHHVHHLSAKIPNYNLQRAHDENPIFHSGAEPLAVGRPAGRALEALGRGSRPVGDLRAGAGGLATASSRRRAGSGRVARARSRRCWRSPRR